MTALPLPPLLALVAALGLAIGSFLNVVVHRVPAGLSVLHPPSACPACGHRVRERDNVPVVSWLLLRGRCRDCRMPISWRYPAVEAGTAVLFVAVAAHLVDTGAGVPLVLACLVVAAAGVALALIDLEHGRLPFAVTGAAAALAGGSLAVGWLGGASVVPALVGAGLWTGVYGGTWLVTAGRGMGLGDVALAPMLGLVLGAVGVAEAAVGLAAGFVLGAVVGGALLVARATGPSHERVAAPGGLRIPFGPFMLVGAAVGLFVGGPLATAYLHLVGLA